MRSQMHTQDIQYNIQCSVRVQVEIANQGNDFLPNRSGAVFDCCGGEWGKRGSKTAGEFGGEFRVSFGLFAEEVEFILFVE